MPNEKATNPCRENSGSDSSGDSGDGGAPLNTSSPVMPAAPHQAQGNGPLVVHGPGAAHMQPTYENHGPNMGGPSVQHLSTSHLGPTTTAWQPHQLQPMPGNLHINVSQGQYLS